MAFPYSSGDVLTATDLNASSGLVLVKSQTVGSGVSSVTVTNAFSSTFQNYRIIYAGINCTSGDTFLQLQLGASAASYYGCFVAANYTTGTQTVFTRNNASVAYVGVTSTNTDTMGTFDIQQPFDTGRTHLQGTGFGYTTSFFFGMEHVPPTSYSSFVLSPNSGTMTGGTIRVYGYNDG